MFNNEQKNKQQTAENNLNQNQPTSSTSQAINNAPHITTEQKNQVEDIYSNVNLGAPAPLPMDNSSSPEPQPTEYPSAGFLTTGKKYLILALLIVLAVVLAGGTYLAFSFFRSNADTNITPPTNNAVDIEKEVSPTNSASEEESLIMVATSAPELEEITPPDADGDGLNDLLERDEGTNPASMDTDGDILNDWEEINIYFSNPLLADTDSDGLSDYEEVKNYQTDVRNPDSDSDGYLDGAEVVNGYNPLGAGRLQ